MIDSIERDTICEYISGTGAYVPICIIRTDIVKLGETLSDYIHALNRYYVEIKNKEDESLVLSSLINKAMSIGDSEYVHRSNVSSEMSSAIELLEDINTCSFTGDDDLVICDDMVRLTQTALLEVMTQIWDGISNYINADEIRVVTDIPMHSSDDLLLGYNRSVIVPLYNPAGRVVELLNSSVTSEFMLFKRTNRNIN